MEKKAKHTPGPWNVGIGYEYISVQGREDDGFPIVVRWNFSARQNPPDDILNNARLIAAAPELKRFAEAIEESVNDALRPGSPDNFMSLVKRLQYYRAWAQAAIAKAAK